MIVELLASGALGGWLAADTTALVQTLVGSPLVGGALTGLVWGDLALGLRVGTLLQLYARAGLPLGGRTPGDYASAGVVGVAVAAILGRSIPGTFAVVPTVLGVVAGLVVGVAGRPVIRWVRLRNEGLTRWAEGELLAGRARALDTAHWLGVAHAFLVGAGFTLAGVALLAAAGRLVWVLDGFAVERAVMVAEPLLWGVGAGLAVRQLLPLTKGAAALFLVIFVLLLTLRLGGHP